MQSVTHRFAVCRTKQPENKTQIKREEGKKYLNLCNHENENMKHLCVF